jgi:hypothetical protein
MFINSTKKRDEASICGSGATQQSGALLLGLLLAACAAPVKPAEPAKASAKPVAPIASAEAPFAPEAPLPTLSAASLTANEVTGVQQLSLVARGQDGAFELLEYSLPVGFAVSAWQRNELHLDTAGLPYAFIGQSAGEPQRGAGPARLWVRRPLDDKAQDLSGDCYTSGNSGAGNHYRWHAAAAPNQKLEPKLTAAWLDALATDFRMHHGAFYGFAAGKLNERLPKPRPTKGQRVYTPQASTELTELIGTTTGRTSVQEALEQKSALYIDLQSGPRKVALSKLQAPQLPRHPWSNMLAQLSRKGSPEALAGATPADFYFLRIRDFSTFLDLSELADSWGAPALDLLDGKLQNRDLRARYETELALQEGELTRTFGPSVVEELAIVGSDPYLVEGSDLTLIFKVKSALLFDAALLKAQDSFSSLHPGLDIQKTALEGVEITATRSRDGLVRRQRATVDGLELVSNSPAAIRRVISAIHGKVPRLADEPDFAYMLARDADRDSTVLAFAGDRFVASVVGPQQKIKAAERELALAEISRPGYAALLYGFLNGHSPTSTKDLVTAGLLTPADLKPGGVAANFQPGAAAESSRGSTLGMLPLIDSPDISLVTAAEQAGYDAFARSYESEWSDYVDPFAVRVSRAAPAGGPSTLTAELRVLPLLRREYRELMSSVGKARVRPGMLPEGFRMLLGVGKDAELRHLLTSASRRLTEHELSFDWLGDYAFVGVADKNELAVAARYQSDIYAGPWNDDSTRAQSLAAAAHTPLYAGIAIRSTARAAIALGLLHKISDEVAPGVVVWTEARKHRGVSVMSVHGTEEDTQDFTLYYALTSHALLLSLSPAVLEAVIDQYLDGNGPTAVDGKPSSSDAQLVVDLKAKPQGGLSMVLSWLLTRTLTENTGAAQDAASAIFHGAPELSGSPDRAATLMQNYFGSVVLTPEGKSYGFGLAGVEDPLRGSLAAPKWPVIPVPGSPVAKVLDRLAQLRSEVSFDDEPNGGPPGTGTALQSLRVRITLSLR